jgi:LmbE family N-acetylglucosaminyl deacetylase
MLGCAGTLARHARMGDEVHVLIAGEGATARGEETAAPESVRALRGAAEEAARIVGAQPPRFLGLPDERLDGMDLLDLVRRMEAVLTEVGPEVIYTHHGGDLNLDHRLIHQAVMTACRPMPGQAVRSIYTFETVSSTEWGSSATGESFRPTRFVDISGDLAAKMKALDCYEAEMRPFPHARSYQGIRALAALRGSSVGVEAAEAFMVVRELVA